MKKILMLFLCTQAIYAADITKDRESTSWLSEEVAAINSLFGTIQEHHSTLISSEPSAALKEKAAYSKVFSRVKLRTKSKDSL